MQLTNATAILPTSDPVAQMVGELQTGREPNTPLHPSSLSDKVMESAASDHSLPARGSSGATCSSVAMSRTR